MTENTCPRLIVATDLDGTLLDHHDYSWDAARPAMTKLENLGIPVILNTSKTYSEVLDLQQQLGIAGPFIVENGSALLLPTEPFNWLLDGLENANVERLGEYYQVVLGARRKDIIDFIHELRSGNSWQFAGFSDWSVQQIMDNTGLDQTSAGKAAEKMFSEPIRWDDSAENLEEFTAQVVQQDYTLLRGGRFYHVQGQTDKGKPLLWLQNLYAAKTGTRPKLICLGDSENDVQMLNVADFPVCVRSPVGDYPMVDTDRPVILTEAYGPAGWNEAINDILLATNL